jgi:hypothetical protein
VTPEDFAEHLQVSLSQTALEAEVHWAKRLLVLHDTSGYFDVNQIVHV